MTELRPVPDGLLTRAELAKEMRVSVRTIDQWRSEGMPCVPMGAKLIRFRPTACWRWLERYHKAAA